jgi:hypothetical protein
LEETICSAVRHLYRWLDKELPNGESFLAWPTGPSRHRILRLYPPPGQRTDWVQAHDGRCAAFAEVRLVNVDSLVMQLAYGSKGEADVEARAELSTAAWQPPEDPSLFVGHLRCLAGRVTDLATARALPTR